MTERWHWIALFGAYFLTQMVIRVLVGPTLELDEAEAFWFARNLQLGYNAQPPLYFWLQWTFFQALGETVLALAMLKAALLWGACAVLFLWLSRQVTVLQAGVAVLALGLLPQVVWEAQRALTHSVLVFALSVGFVVALHRFLRRGRWCDAVVLGVVTGLGVISKYNFAVLALAFLMWAALSPVGRGVNWFRVSAAMGVAAAIVAPVAVWSIANRNLAGASVHKLGLEESGFVAARVEGLLSLGLGVVSFFALAIVVLGGLWFWRDRRSAVLPEVVCYLAGGVAVALVLLLAGVVVAGVTNIQDRWLLPIVWPLVPAAVLWLWPVLGLRQRRRLGIGTGVCWGVATLALPYASLRDPGYRAGNFVELEVAMAAVDPAPQVVVSNAIWVMGNLALRNPDMPLIWAMEGGGTGLLVAETGQGVDIVERLGLVAGEPIKHRITHGAREREVEITPVTQP